MRYYWYKYPIIYQIIDISDYWPTILILVVTTMVGPVHQFCDDETHVHPASENWMRHPAVEKNTSSPKKIKWCSRLSYIRIWQWPTQIVQQCHVLHLQLTLQKEVYPFQFNEYAKPRSKDMCIIPVVGEIRTKQLDTHLLIWTISTTGNNG